MIVRIIDKLDKVTVCSGQFVENLPGHREVNEDQMKRYYKMTKFSRDYKATARAIGINRYVIRHGNDYTVVPMNGRYRLEWV
jgi:negative regulator of sigma E activity